MSQSIFGAYGIRGVWGKELKPEMVAKVAIAFAIQEQPKRVVVGRDGRWSSAEISQILIDRFLESGIQVVDIGLVSIDVFYFAVAHLKSDGGAMVTASHNPPEWNGVKFTDRRAQLLVGEQNRSLGRLVESGRGLPAGKTVASVKRYDVVPEFIRYISPPPEWAGLRPLRLVVDPGNGATASIFPRLFQGTPVLWSGIHLDVDGGFPGRGPDPKKPGALDQLGAAVRERQADLGAAFDADGDRLFLVDERGQSLSGETTGLLLARAFLDRHPGGAIVYNVVCSHAVPEIIRAWGGQPVRAGVGSVNIKPALARTNGLLGIETSGHYIIPAKNFLDSGLLPMVIALQEISRREQPVSKLSSELNRYAHAFLDLTHHDVDGAKERVRQAYRRWVLDELDGLTVECPTWWCNVRASNTEPLLRLTVEAKTADEVRQRCDELLALIRGPRMAGDFAGGAAANLEVG